MSTEESIGERLRSARLARRLSLRGVAQQLGVSASLISQVETGKTRPSVATLYALASHLDVSLDELLGLGAVERPGGAATPVSSSVQRSSDNPVIEMENGVRWERLAMQPGGAADPVLVSYAPGASSSIEGKLMQHRGQEYGYVLEGTITLQLEFDTFELHPGDSFHFDSERPHIVSNRGDVEAKGVWFIVGRGSAGSVLGAHEAGQAQRSSESGTDALHRSIGA
ncbi:helix-turn-helix domain-containing protein [Leucobacter triazinivorans]|uniref:Cupin domain-containing protein n=1 Tax=Leucobacter triazinivorans TaxID=1784719 RepID=A0A4P6KFG9_9MICO|nr:XRE family transcriptional regulator [Leucobacter triazinivorans]QBE49072.1 cupin domain-containing protein [Leucobacter triazinivorans]